ncbi:tRNA pseudouridine(65) synthase TruC [Cellvibrio sp. KY-GH-1]|uniref:tRNA pseudouridine(65) synthase TruC n=1 Tax=Cellvibrio sp. KY-GH-1 TaxID=2303332 RepID=UPI001245B235|nr:tRNA pseudouridine(65) synthase TruC [Cellvibrio sp. KY-GH-1]QEY14976.1 tRNA pseudouridine(65) synthase TruC [Cellvibrio sp. KY-GH-1]
MTELLPIIYCDEHLVAINKPSGLLVHRSEIDRHETRFAMQLVRDQLGQQVFPVHRLDKPTAGVLIFALSAHIAKKMGDIFSQHSLEKTYIALVRGHTPASIVVDHPLIEELDKYTDKKARSDKPAQTAVTVFKTLATIELPFSVDKYPSTRYSLVECKPRTGRKHQIRRHLKHISHPIIGDAKHGKGIHNRFFQNQFNCSGLMLAATELQFNHPVTQAPLKFVAPLEAKFSRVLHDFAWHNAVPSSWLETV